ncbi:MAG: T9SS type A sorting domain-containing protein [Saprospiraceae bacterium]|nr:T9SS type A sorting domain-containing protein [Saprospiraceae bacterium]
MNFKNVLLVLMLGFTMQATAQLDCNCTTDYAPVCAVDSSGTYVEFPNTCWANCLGFTVVTDTTLCDNSNPWGDCGCVITDSTYVCAADSIGNIFPVPNACFAACWGLTVVTDSTSCDGWGGCVCPEIYDPVCAVDSLGNYYEAPNACYAACWGMTVVTDSTLCYFGNGDCGCVITDSTYVCATDSIGNIFPVPNACFAACWGLTVVTDSTSCDGWGGCVCPEIYDPVCAVDSLGNYYEAPNACYAACWGMTVVTDSTLCDFGNGDCGCVITDSTYVCATDSIGNIFPVPNACFAACWGLTVVENGDCDTNPWEDCDCEFDENEPFICAVDSLGHPCYVPNACYAACWGLTVTNDSICNVTDIDPEIDYDILNCIDSLYLTENTTFQEALLLISQSCGLELPVCIADAPLFTTDSAFIAFIIANCDGVFGFNGNSSGSNVMNIYNVVNNSRLSSTGDIKAYPSELTLAANPIQQQLSYHIQVKSALDATISLLNINGQTIFKENVSLAPGKQSFSRDISGLKSGVYLLNLSSGTQQQTVRVVVVQ